MSMQSLTFREYLKRELRTPTPKDFDPDGSSSRAVLMRGRFKEILWQYRKTPQNLKRFFSEFDGMHTPLGWFIGLLLILLFLPVIPLLSAIGSRERALRHYEVYYDDDFTPH